MKNKFSKKWNTSVQVRKQRKFRYNAPLHIRRKFVASHLAKELRAKYSRRSLLVRKGDKEKIMRGQHKGKTGKVERVDIKKTKIYVAGIDKTKKDGSKSFYPFQPSNLLITELVLDDKKRQVILQRNITPQKGTQNDKKSS